MLSAILAQNRSREILFHLSTCHNLLIYNPDYTSKVAAFPIFSCDSDVTTLLDENFIVLVDTCLTIRYHVMTTNFPWFQMLLKGGFVRSKYSGISQGKDTISGV